MTTPLVIDNTYSPGPLPGRGGAEGGQTGMIRVPALEIGGTHVTAACVDPAAGEPAGEAVRAPLPAQGTAAEILDRVAAAADRIGAPAGSVWGVAVPGPFDYEAGVGRFRDVGKFEALDGLDVGAELRRRLRPAPAALRFLNDADAFGIGEYVAGSAAGHTRAVCLTLGSGVGSAFLDRGEPVGDGPLVPPDSSAHLLCYDGRPLEETVSRRAIRAAYARATQAASDAVPDVRTIAELARGGDRRAYGVIERAFWALGVTLAPWLARFEATALVVGGSIAASWDLLETPLAGGLAAGPGGALTERLVLRTAGRADDAALLGAACWAVHSRSAPPGGR